MDVEALNNSLITHLAEVIVPITDRLEVPGLVEENHAIHHGFKIGHCIGRGNGHCYPQLSGMLGSYTGDRPRTISPVNVAHDNY